MRNQALEIPGTEDAVEEVIAFKDAVWNWLTDSQMWMDVLYAGIRIIIIFLLTRLIIRIVYKVIDRSLTRQGNSRLNLNPRRFVTVGELLKNVTSFVCNFVMVLIVLGEFNFEIAPLLASAGVLGLAIGFGAQSLVKDIITGFFIILEDQFAVGDVIQTGTFKGTVEMIGIRTTRIVSHTGELFILPNGSISTVTNYSVSNALAVVDLPIKNERTLEDTLQLMKKVLVNIQEKNTNMISAPNVLGIQSLSTSEYVIRIVAECLPNTKGEVESQIQMGVKQALEHEEARIQAERDKVQA
ncbi:mechanosensitive ion channel family protein [Paenibacillus sp. IHBB 10380]|uniref:mechanosensitive ion channel family protein n=1 Tax=Paenibacillus sp. IHBB 10380 TaxID=1566358 RepID=UPI0005CFEC5D|nr:mechanosensitive ion channel family protein [Paenibacillus sp. IHBB 10380]